MSLWSWFRKTTSKQESSGAYKWKNPELGLYFEARSDDPVWAVITPALAELIQQGLNDIFSRARLDNYSSTNDLPADAIQVIGDVANEIGEPNNLNPIFMILMAHQYVDADQLARSMYRSRWVAFMVKRSTFAPSPESYVDFVKAKYFPGRFG